MCVTVAAGGLMLPLARAFFAYNFACDWHSAFVPEPTKTPRFGYVTDFEGLGLTAPLAKDLVVHVPWTNASAPSYTPVSISNHEAHVVGVIENISWAGGVGDAFTVSCYMSQENAHKLAALKQTALKTTAISSFGFWIASYDQEAKKWYEEIHPLAPTKIMGQLSAPSKTDIRLHIGDEGVKVSPAVDVKVYNVYFEVVPAANQTANFTIATSSSMKTVKGWGLVVGTLHK